MNFKRRGAFPIVKSFITVVALFFVLGGAFSQAPLRTAKLFLLDSENKEIVLTVELADNSRSRTYGLMHRKELAENSGMLFVYKSDQYLNFWMKNVTVPLSIAFIDAKGVIQNIQHMEPLDITKTYLSSSPVRYALEVNMGWFEKNNIKVGNRVILNGCISK